jgi:phenol 2-monooxygenase
MGITYTPTNPFVISGSLGDFVAGSRCPDFSLTDKDDVKTFFYQQFSYGKFLVLLPEAVKLHIPSVASQHVVVWKISVPGPNAGNYRATLLDGRELTTEFGLGKSGDTAIIIRPDLYVGYVGNEPGEYFTGAFV